MIRHFRCKDTETLFMDQWVGRFSGILQPARRKLILLDQAANLLDLRIPSGNQLESLKGDRQGQYSIRINQQWRLCFEWQDGDAVNVEIVDYH